MWEYSAFPASDAFLVLPERELLAERGLSISDNTNGDDDTSSVYSPFLLPGAVLGSIGLYVFAAGVFVAVDRPLYRIGAAAVAAILSGLAGYLLGRLIPFRNSSWQFPVSR